MVFESDHVRIIMPAQFAADCTWSQSSDELISLSADDGSIICTLSWGETAAHGNEAKGESALIGEIALGASNEPVFFFTSGLDAEGRSIYAGSDEQPVSLATEHYLGVEPDEVISWVELDSGSGWVPTEASEGDVSGESGSNGATAGAVADEGAADAPFWGIWVGASTDPGEAEAIASAVRDQGFEADVVLTTDWSNLNSEPWYVVTAGRHDSEDQANALLGAVQSAGWPDAYVKYSGDPL